MSAEIDQPDLLQNELPKQYQVLGEIKSGGMGAIYKVENRFTKVIYAIKVKYFLKTLMPILIY